MFLSSNDTALHVLLVKAVPFSFSLICLSTLKNDMVSRYSVFGVCEGGLCFLCPSHFPYALCFWCKSKGRRCVSFDLLLPESSLHHNLISCIFFLLFSLFFFFCQMVVSRMVSSMVLTTSGTVHIWAAFWSVPAMESLESSVKANLKVSLCVCVCYFFNPY